MPRRHGWPRRTANTQTLTGAGLCEPGPRLTAGRGECEKRPDRSRIQGFTDQPLLVLRAVATKAGRITNSSDNRVLSMPRQMIGAVFGD